MHILRFGKNKKLNQNQKSLKNFSKKTKLNILQRLFHKCQV